MPKITVYVSSDLEKRLKKNKSLNASEVCQHALNQALDALLAEDSGRAVDNKILERLRKEKQENKETSVKLGVRDGLAAAINMSYADLQTYAEAEPHFLKWGDLPEETQEDIKDELREEGNESDYYGMDEAMFLRGWLAGVKKFWVQVSPRL